MSAQEFQLRQAEFSTVWFTGFDSLWFHMKIDPPKKELGISAGEPTLFDMDVFSFWLDSVLILQML